MRIREKYVAGIKIKCHFYEWRDQFLNLQTPFAVVQNT